MNFTTAVIHATTEAIRSKEDRFIVRRDDACAVVRESACATYRVTPANQIAIRTDDGLWVNHGDALSKSNARAIRNGARVRGVDDVVSS